jgi:hypothetical protein
MADNPEKTNSWWLTLPALLTAATGFIGAITALIIGLNQVGLFGSHRSHTTTSSPATPVTSHAPPSDVQTITLPEVGADWQGFPEPSFARCLDRHPAAAIAETTLSHLVICRLGPNDFHYPGIGNNGGDGIALPGAVPVVDPSGSPVGFDVTDSDGIKYQVRSDKLTILMLGRPPRSERMLQYASTK